MRNAPDWTFAPRRPPLRRLWIYTFDPGMATNLQAAQITCMTVEVPWENELDLGEDDDYPDGVCLRGEYVKIFDRDGTEHYPPVDLNHPFVLASNGLTPCESDPQFHQQMVYAVMMTTITHFERTLGRRVQWAPRSGRAAAAGGDPFVRRLVVYPHWDRMANAYYDPNDKSLKFGYFNATTKVKGHGLPGGIVYTCLSHDVIAHETAHALLDGMHRCYLEPTNLDVLAFHEGFADIVAVFQHFSHFEVVRHQMASTRGDLSAPNLLANLAHQLGEGLGLSGPLRNAIGRLDEKGQWILADPTPDDYSNAKEEHDRGNVLVAAVFEAYRTIFAGRTRDLVRLATNGTSVLPGGELQPDLINRLAREAMVSAKHVLTMCIRALDYCPPVDLTFGDYLRALITADMDLVENDNLGYRLAFIDAFRRRGIYPDHVVSMAPESLQWDNAGSMGVGEDVVMPDFDRRELLNDLADWNMRADREWLFRRGEALKLHVRELILRLSEAWGRTLDHLTGMVFDKAQCHSIHWTDDDCPFAVVGAFPTRRVGPDGNLRSDFVIMLRQDRGGYFNAADQNGADAGDPVGSPDFTFSGGCTIILDMDTAYPRYFIRKNVRSLDRMGRQRSFLLPPKGIPLHGLSYWNQSARQNPFRIMHSRRFR